MCSVAPFYWQFYFTNKFIESSVIEKLWPLEKQEIVFVAYLYYSQTSLNRSKWTYQNIKVSNYLCLDDVHLEFCKLQLSWLARSCAACCACDYEHCTEQNCIAYAYIITDLELNQICVSDVVVDLWTNIIWLILSVASKCWNCFTYYKYYVPCYLLLAVWIWASSWLNILFLFERIHSSFHSFACIEKLFISQ